MSPPRNFTARVQENATIGTQVVHVHAVDTDIGEHLTTTQFSKDSML